MSAPRARNTYGDGQIDQYITKLLETVGTDTNDDLVRRLLVTALDMDAAEIDRLELKIASQSLVEMLHAWTVFSPYRDRPKCTVFGSARTPSDHPDYQLAVDFGRQIAAQDWMIISGGGPGIMTAIIEGAGRENSFGVNIVLPFEQRAAEIIDGDPKLATFKYFFTRKLFFMKESDAFVLFPGGFGTLDEAFELITLVQTGKSYPAPIVLMDQPGSTYWSSFQTFVNDALGETGMISKDDTSLYLHTHDPAQAVNYITHYYRCFHSLRYVGRRLVLRLRRPLSENALIALNAEFADIVRDGEITPIETTADEIASNDFVDLPRIAFRFDDRSFARLHQLIFRINDLGPEPHEHIASTGLMHDLPDLPNGSGNSAP